ncbi:MAG: DAK2 domain-containing protein [Thermomicrobiales bacterium]
MHTQILFCPTPTVMRPEYMGSGFVKAVNVMYSQPGQEDANVPASAIPQDTVSGARLLASLRHAAIVISDHRDQLNSLNVFPVPDGDTGTNMSMTMNAAIDAMGDEDSPELTVDRVASTFAFGALMGARGNSGVILSQILRGFANSVEGKSQLTAAQLVAAINNAAVTAYKAVITPVEGTMLTVMTGAATRANSSLLEGGGIPDILEAAAQGAAESLSHTPEMLEVLMKARVVDAGGQGIAYMLRAIANRSRGDTTPIQIGEINPKPYIDSSDSTGSTDTHEGSGFCTNFVVFGDDLDLDILRERFGEAGDSAVVIGDRTVVKVHIHTDRPDRVLTLAMTFGNLDRVSIDNMDRQIEDLAAQARQDRQRSATGYDIIAIVDGAGLGKALLSVGATAVFQRGSGGRGALHELGEMIESAESGCIVVLATSTECLPEIHAVASKSGKDVTVVEATSFVAALTALSDLTLTHDFTAAVAHMRRTIDATESIELVTGDGGVNLRINGTVRTTANTASSALISGLQEVAVIDPEICTIFTGIGAGQAEIESVLRTLADTYPDASIEVVEGGQSDSTFIIALE